MQAITVLCATLNACEAVRLTLQSLRRFTPPIYALLVADNGSTDGTLEMLKDDPSIKLFTPADRGLQDGGPSTERLHGATLDWLAAQVETPYFLTLDSDVEFFAVGWMEELLALARSEHLVALGEYEPAQGAYSARLAPHVLLVETRAFRELETTFRASVQIGDPTEARRWQSRPPSFEVTMDELASYSTASFFPTGAIFHQRMIERGLTWGIPAPQTTAKYLHLRHRSWRGAETGERESDAAHGQTTEYIRERLRRWTPDREPLEPASEGC